MSSKIPSPTTKKLNRYYKKIQSLQKAETTPFQKNFSALFTLSTNSTSSTKIDISQYIIPESLDSMNIEHPAFNPNMDYKTHCSKMEDTIQKTLDSLKDVCILSNLYSSMDGAQKSKILDSLNTDPVSEALTTDFACIKRARRKNQEISEALDCPFLGCAKTYGSRTALKLHIKRSHEINAPTKKNLKQCLTSIVTSTGTKGVNYEKVVVKKFKVKDSVEIPAEKSFPESCEALSKRPPVYQTTASQSFKDATEEDSVVDEAILARNANLRQQHLENKKAAKLM